jgi:hypothetical protein
MASFGRRKSLKGRLTERSRFQPARLIFVGPTQERQLGVSRLQKHVYIRVVKAPRRSCHPHRTPHVNGQANHKGQVRRRSRAPLHPCSLALAKRSAAKRRPVRDVVLRDLRRLFVSALLCCSCGGGLGWPCTDTRLLSRSLHCFS